MRTDEKEWVGNGTKSAGSVVSLYSMSTEGGKYRTVGVTIFTTDNLS